MLVFLGRHVFCYRFIHHNKRGVFFMRLSELSGKEIVDVKRAERLGVLGQTDLEINEQDGQITALIIPSVKWFGLGRKQGNDIKVPWSQIQKIGSDMIILDVPESSVTKEE